MGWRWRSWEGSGGERVQQEQHREELSRKGHSGRGHGGRAVAGGPGGRRHTQAARWVARVHAPPRASGARRSGRSAGSIMESSVAAWHNGKSSWSVVGRAGDRGRRSGAGAWTGWRSCASRALARRLGLGLPVSGAGGKSAAWHKAARASEQTSYHLDRWVERASVHALLAASGEIRAFGGRGYVNGLAVVWCMNEDPVMHGGRMVRPRCDLT